MPPATWPTRAVAAAHERHLPHDMRQAEHRERDQVERHRGHQGEPDRERREIGRQRDPERATRAETQQHPQHERLDQHHPGLDGEEPDRSCVGRQRRCRAPSEWMGEARSGHGRDEDPKQARRGGDRRDGRSPEQCDDDALDDERERQCRALAHQRCDVTGGLSATTTAASCRARQALPTCTARPPAAPPANRGNRSAARTP